MLHEIADAVAVDRVAEPDLGRDLVAFGHRDVPHVVAEARELRPLPVVPRARHAHPRADPVLHFRIGPMADDHLAVEPQPGVDEPGLAVAVRRLVEVHEIHVDLAPRQVAIELRVQVQKRLAPAASARRSTSSRAKRCASTGSSPAQLAASFASRQSCAHFLRRREDRLEDELERKALRRRSSSSTILLRIRRDLLERLGTVEMLAAGDVPDFGSGEMDHGIFIDWLCVRVDADEYPS